MIDPRPDLPMKLFIASLEKLLANSHLQFSKRTGAMVIKLVLATVDYFEGPNLDRWTGKLLFLLFFGALT